MFKLFKKLAGYMLYLKYPIYLLAFTSLGITLLAIFKPDLIEADELLFLSLVIFIWSLLLIIFPVIFNQLTDFSHSPEGLFAKLKQFVHKAITYLIALLFVLLSLAMLFLTYKMLLITFL